MQVLVTNAWFYWAERNQNRMIIPMKCPATCPPQGDSKMQAQRKILWPFLTTYWGINNPSSIHRLQRDDFGNRLFGTGVSPIWVYPAARMTSLTEIMFSEAHCCFFTGWISPPPPFPALPPSSPCPQAHWSPLGPFQTSILSSHKAFGFEPLYASLRSFLLLRMVNSKMPQHKGAFSDQSV